MTSTDPTEKWWERLIRAIGGWALAGGVVYAIAVGKWPTDSKAMVIFAAFLVSLGVGMAHSTVFGIWLNMANRYLGLDRVVAFFSRKGYERRDEDPGTGAHGTRVVSSIKPGTTDKRRRRDK